MAVLVVMLLLGTTACGNSNTIDSPSPNCFPKFSLDKALKSFITSAEGETPLVLPFSVAVDKSCPNVIISAMDVGGTTEVRSTKILIALGYPNMAYSLTTLCWFDCPEGECRSNLPFSNHLRIAPGESLLLGIYGSSFHQGQQSTLTPKIYGLTWRTTERIENSFSRQTTYSRRSSAPPSRSTYVDFLTASAVFLF